jgi:hypothetical protein
VQRGEREREGERGRALPPPSPVSWLGTQPLPLPQANHLLHVATVTGETLVDVPAGELTRCPHFTTKDAVEELLKPYLQVARSSLCEALAGAGMRDEDERGPLAGLGAWLRASGVAAVSVSTAFVSHAWKYPFWSSIYIVVRPRGVF